MLLKPLTGRDRVAKFLLTAEAQAASGTRHAIGMVNSAPAIVSSIDSKPIGVLSFDVYDGRIQNLFITADPEKLHAIDFIRDIDSNERPRIGLPQ